MPLIERSLHIAPLLLAAGIVSAVGSPGPIASRSTVAATTLAQGGGITIAGVLEGGVVGTARLTLSGHDQMVVSHGFASVLINDPHLVADDSATIDGARGVIDVLANDLDPDGGPLHIIDASPGEHGAVYIVDGKLLYLPRPGTDFDGTDHLIYTVEDAEGYRATAEVELTLQGWRRITVVTADADGSLGSEVLLDVPDGYLPPFGEGIVPHGVTPASDAAHTFEPVPAEHTSVIDFDDPMTAITRAGDAPAQEARWRWTPLAWAVP